METAAERARRVLGKGIRKKRFRRLKKWEVKNRYMLGLMFADDIKVSDMAERIGVSPRTVQAWIYEGRIPKDKNIEKICKELDCPEDILFRELK
ncbi:helix-turn-helix domain-containing protein [Alkaliphilus serpentinus]|uniref:Helix-turn-helix transcriptional regulator n=1 Tax=Alkaliphilus serpentinus TaxID=1482731 RepID=A0A833HNC8_9FIRM|nr:helix-turn-helix transcriptional regulator [Alkaliphilus serpentinus]KAB3529255.1 helix-turn-helix transcriptional regulator [Alkaliphilus serpentinus]